MKKEAAVDSPEFYVKLVILAIVLLTVKHFWPDLIPFKEFELLFLDFSFEKLATIPWPLLLVTPVLFIIARLTTTSSRLNNLDIVYNIKTKLWTAFKAGIFEEISFRWIGFYYLILGFSLDNLLINWLSSLGYIEAILSLPWWVICIIILAGNFCGFIALAFARDEDTNSLVRLIALGLAGVIFLLDFTVLLILIKTWYIALVIPFVNFITLDKLSPQLLGYSWVVGAALVSSNWTFGKGHAYQGPIGWIDAWIFGLFMFWAAFNFGLFAAIIVHACYNIILCVVAYLDARHELAN